MKKTQRFIAGANCPKCNEIDTLLVDSEDESIECVECGFTQTAQDRDTKQTEEQVSKSIPKKVNVSNIIRVNQIKE